MKACTLHPSFCWLTFVSALTQFYDHVYQDLQSCFALVLLPSWCLFISVAWCFCPPKAKLSGVELAGSLLSYSYPNYPLRTKTCFGFNDFVAPSGVVVSSSHFVSATPSFLCSSPAPGWGLSHKRQSFTNFSSGGPPHALQFFTNRSSMGTFQGLQSFRNELLQCRSPMAP